MTTPQCDCLPPRPSVSKSNARYFSKGSEYARNMAFAAIISVLMTFNTGAGVWGLLGSGFGVYQGLYGMGTLQYPLNC